MEVSAVNTTVTVTQSSYVAAVAGARPSDVVVTGMVHRY
jgi:hypothetical protein